MGGLDVTLEPGSDLLHLILRGRWDAAVLDGTDCAALVTRHREYEALDLGRLKDAMVGSVLVDGRNGLGPDVCVQAGFIASKAERLLALRPGSGQGWRPQTRFREGVARLVDWYRENREWAREVRTI